MPVVTREPDESATYTAIGVSALRLPPLTGCYNVAIGYHPLGLDLDSWLATDGPMREVERALGFKRGWYGRNA